MFLIIANKLTSSVEMIMPTIKAIANAIVIAMITSDVLIVFNPLSFVFVVSYEFTNSRYQCCSD